MSIMTFDDIIDGAVKGKAVIDVKKIEYKVSENGKARLNAQCVVTEGEPQGAAEVDPAGEFFFQSFPVPNAETTAQGSAFMRRKIKEFLSAVGVDLSAGVDLEEVETLTEELLPASLSVQLGEDRWTLENKNESVTTITKIYGPAE